MAQRGTRRAIRCAQCSLSVPHVPFRSILFLWSKLKLNLDLPQDLQPELDPYTRRYRPLELTPWQRTFLNNHLADLWRLAIAVNYLDVASLYNAVCFFIGDLIAKEATPGRIANGQAVGSLKAMFDPNHGQSARTTRTAGRTKEQVIRREKL